jgi:predicted amidohydrolase
MVIKVAALQLKFECAATPQEFTDRVRAPIERAARESAQLIALPNYCSYALFGMFAPDLPANATLDEIFHAEGMVNSPGGEPSDSAAALMRDRAQLVHEFHVHIFQSLAERTETWLVPGTAPEVREGNWFNSALLFAPDGKIFGRQRQMHRSPQEREWGMGVGDEPRVFNTDVGRVGLVIGEDVRYPEVSRILTLQGAKMLIHPAAMHEAADEQFLADILREVQSNQVFGVQANPVGRNYHGRSAIYAPVEYTADHRGILAQASGDSEEEVVVAELNIELALSDQ